MELLQGILENSQYAFLTAAILGLMTAISPCPLATNISAIGFISRDLTDSRRVFMNGLVYTLGRAITYVGIALIIFFGASQMDISGWFQRWGEKVLGPALIVIGLFMLDFIKLRLPGGIASITEKIGEKGRRSYLNTLLLGILFAMAFCPYSGVLYFVMLIPMTVASADGLYLPLIFAIATGIPVIIFAWLLAYAVGNVGKMYSRIRTFELWFRRVVAVLFIGVGIWYVFSVWL
ncbi:MAG TPA: aromatic aminobenezylarsenical efflux permease ArsG family transporter [Bacteroidales bacterium]|jgi:threonine/homoserine/homoserine lactone efflux protein|nr:aromatic aminobenezylarsenical efflux permease ArsG family transporter [Bacteroidales bacterium]NLD62423.1 sulfite exporter TauE/SafE family protein [Bacteroidales bacterium]HNT92104.1 aromatic aminobenezylarsenical efflux permease ArsG family transporter [Bacteroidales bacterium]HOO65632.1 aromatic aminobenezylarsenical efflux permease ArsG family transporter [Bacteroidales bacterium]HPE21603.1 aromatic aminobenezylarsenical efflux permease ArsG family transporter [Bacteroidales bacterium]